jgi:hypothetical protein
MGMWTIFKIVIPTEGFNPIGGICGSPAAHSSPRTRRSLDYAATLRVSTSLAMTIR